MEWMQYPFSGSYSRVATADNMGVGADKARMNVSFQVSENVAISAIVLFVSISTGLTMLGSPFSASQPVGTDGSGFLSTLEFFGMIVMVALCPLGFMMWARACTDLNLVSSTQADPAPLPGIAIPQGHHRTSKSLLGMLSLMCIVAIVGLSLSLAVLVQPSKTLVQSAIVGTNDPQLVAVGVFLFIACAFLFLLNAGLLVHAAFPSAHWKPSPFTRVAMFVILCAALL